MQVFYFGVVDKKTNLVSTEMASANEESAIAGLKELLLGFYPGKNHAIFSGIYHLEKSGIYPRREIWSTAGEIVKKAGFSNQHTIYRISLANLSRFFPVIASKPISQPSACAA